MKDEEGKINWFENGLFIRLTELNSTVREYAILLYQLMKDPGTPKFAKIAIVSLLGVLILPLEVVGNIGILATLIGLILKLERYITPEMRERAKTWT